MGVRGPIPNREADLARPRSRKGSEQQDVRKGTMRPTLIPEADENWHPIAKMIWQALIDSGQKDFYQQTDWAFAYSLCEDISLYKQPRYDRDGVEYHKRSPEMLKALMAGMSSLLMTEADRRRVRVELDAPEPPTQSIGDAAIASYRNGLYAVPNPPESEGA